MNITYKNVLVLAPHTDDGEIGCGGSISRIIEQGGNVWYAAFSSARKSLKERGLPEDTLVQEVNAAVQTLGVPKENLILFDHPVREFPRYRQEILDDIIQLRNRIKPDLVFMPSLNDIHQDHKTVAQEALRAFKKITILGYEEPWNNIEFHTRTFIILEKQHVDKKVKALQCYRSQGHRKYLDTEFIYSLAKTRGVQIESEYAESFEVVRFVVY